MKYWTNECYNMYCNYRGDKEYFLYKKQIEKYSEYEKHNIPEWYQNLSLHDNDIIDVEYDDYKLILTLNYDLPKSSPYKICFFNYSIIENCNLINAWIRADELYLEEDNNEFHLLLDSPCLESSIDDDYKRAYFTIKFSQMEMIFNDLVCSLGDGVDESLNPKSTEEIYRALYDEPKWYRNLSLYNSQIYKVEKEENKLLLTLIYNVKLKNNIKFCFYDYEINNDLNISNYCILDDKLFNKYNEIHFALIEYDNGISKNFRTFDIRFSKMEIIIDDLVFTAGKDIDQTINPSVEELESKLKS